MEEQTHVDETPMDVGQLQAKTCMHQNNDQEVEKHVYEEITLRMPWGEVCQGDGTQAEYDIPAEHSTRAGLPTKCQPLLGTECGPVYANTSHSPPEHQTSAEEPKEKAPHLPPKPTGISTTLPALPIPPLTYALILAGTCSATTPPNPEPYVTPVTSGSKGVYMPLCMPRSRQQDHYMSLCNATRGRGREVTTTEAGVDVQA